MTVIVPTDPKSLFTSLGLTSLSYSQLTKPDHASVNSKEAAYSIALNGYKELYAIDAFAEHW